MLRYVIGLPFSVGSAELTCQPLPMAQRGAALDVDEIRLAAIQQEQAALVMVHEIGGRYQFYNEDAHVREGIDVSGFAGHRWQDYAATGRAVTMEEARVKRALHTSEPVSVRVARRWPGRDANLRGTLVSISTPQGTRMVLRRGRIILPRAKSKEVSPTSVEGILQECDYLSDNLALLIGVAARGEMSALVDLLTLAKEAALEERDRITKLALTS